MNPTTIPPLAIFKAYDIRGIVGKGIDENFAEHLGRAFGSEARLTGQKAVVVGRGAQPEYIKTYAYLDTLTQPVLVQQASYFPPFTAAPGGQRLTGKQFVYAGPVERELQYECVLHGVQP